MGPPPPELYSSDEDSDFDDGFVCSSDYNNVNICVNLFFVLNLLSKTKHYFLMFLLTQLGERINKKRDKQPTKEDIDNETARHLYRCISDDDIKGFREIWQFVKLDIDRPLKTFPWTALMYACQSRHVEFVRYLLSELNANPNANSSDMTALILACSGAFDIYGTMNDHSPIEEEKTLQICQMLLDEGRAMVDKANLRRETALMYAAGNGFVSVIKCLLDRKATLEACDVEDRTALFYAVKENRFEAVKVLIEAGALVEAEDRFGHTPKQLAQQLGFDNLLELFPPDPVVEYIPNEFMAYESVFDLIPTAFPDKET